MPAEKSALLQSDGMLIADLARYCFAPGRKAARFARRTQE
jgi:hypothetical protein